MTVLGHWVVVLALIAAGASALQYYRAASAGRNELALPRRLLMASTALLLLASAFLLVLLLRHDFSNGYVFSYSDRSLPLYFLVSAFYAGQEGSFLFWALCSGIIALILMRRSRNAKNEAWIMAVYMAVQTMFVLLVVTKSPFRSLSDMFPEAPPGLVPPDGRGLNPLLQNFWMVIHPPVLFIGFALMAAPFSLALAGLWKKDFSILTAHGFPWILSATSVLGLGIMLGAYWAYGVLGWGGYWGWDPVENSSLVPWLTGIALLHTMLAQLRTGKYLRTNFALSIISFFLVIYSTFLTRSGILGDASVHSFTDPGAGVYWTLIVYLALIAVAGGGLMVKRRKDLAPATSDTLFLSRETSLGAGSLVLILSAAVVLFGTSLPIMSKTRVEPSFYDSTHIPVAIAIGLLIGFSLFTQWEMQDGRDTLKRSLGSFGAALVVTALLAVFGIQNVLVLLFIFSALFAFFVNAEIAVRIARGDWRFLGGKFAHIGVAIFLIGVICTGKFSTQQQIALPLNVPTATLGRTVTYAGHELRPDGKYVFDIVVDDNGSIHHLAPVMFNAGQQGLMRNPDIATTLTRDFYVSPIQLERAPTMDEPETYTLRKGEGVTVGPVLVKFVGFDMNAHKPAMDGSGGMPVGAVLEMRSGKDVENVTPVTVYEQGKDPRPQPAESRLLAGHISLVGMNIGSGENPSTVTVGVERKGTAQSSGSVLLVDASVKPMINLIWAGTVIIMLGFVLSIVKRSKEG